MTDPSREFVREIATGVENVEVGVEVTVVLIVDRDEGLIVVTEVMVLGLDVDEDELL